MVDEATWQQVQDVLSGRRGDIYDYFFCLGRHTGRTECDLPYVPVIAVEQLMEQLWRRVTLSEADIAGTRSRISAELDELAKEQQTAIAAQTKRLEVLERKKQKLIDAYMNDAIPVEDLKQRQAQIAKEAAQASRCVSRHKLMPSAFDNSSTRL